MKLSVLISIYSEEKPEYVSECFRSIFSQTFLPSEVVLVKDGPIPAVLEASIDQLLIDSSIPIKILDLEENVGLGIALQKGLLACSHDYIARMDTDDISHPKRFEKQIEYLKSHPEIDVIGSWITEFDKVTNDLNIKRMVPETNVELYHYAKFRNPMNHMSVVFKKSRVIEAGGYLPFKYLEDYFLWFRMMVNKSNFYNIQESLIFARRGNDLISRRRGWKYFLMEKRLYQEMRKIRFISNFEYLYTLLIRLATRTAPRFFTSFMYDRILR